jgi:hypothetical protein
MTHEEMVAVVKGRKYASEFLPGEKFTHYPRGIGTSTYALNQFDKKNLQSVVKTVKGPGKSKSLLTYTNQVVVFTDGTWAYVHELRGYRWAPHWINKFPYVSEPQIVDPIKKRLGEEILELRHRVKELAGSNLDLRANLRSLQQDYDDLIDSVDSAIALLKCVPVK